MIPTCTRASSKFLLSGAALGVTTGALMALGRYVQREIHRRGYPSWEACRCDFKIKQTIFQIWYSRHEQRGETIVSHEWGSYLSNPAPWLRRLLHYSSQVLATLNPRGRYVERATLSPQESRNFVALLRAASSSEENGEELPENGCQIVWRREILHVPRYPFDAFVRRLYPSHVPSERSEQAQPLPVLWDPACNLPLTTEGNLLDTPIGTRIDYIGWTPSQISYCTARLNAPAEQ